jgi:multiple sugar transport system permease protein
MGFFATLPVEIEKSARIDGCTRVQAILRVVLPMSMSGIAAMAILTFLLSWNEFLFSWILASGTPASTLPPVLPAMLFMIFDHTALFATCILSVIPPIIIAIFFQRYIVRLKIVDPLTTM